MSEDHQEHHHKSGIRNSLDTIYRDHYKPLMIITIVLMIVAWSIIGIHYVSTGTIIDKGISLTGGVSITVDTTKEISTDQIRSYLLSKFPSADFDVRER